MKLDHSLTTFHSFRSDMIHLLSPRVSRCFKYSAAFLFLHISCLSLAQSNIPLESWRLHISYNSILAVAMSDQKVFGASENGVAVLDRSDNSLTTYNKLNGLHGMGITSVAFDNATDQLLIAYNDGIIDVIQNN